QKPNRVPHLAHASPALYGGTTICRIPQAWAAFYNGDQPCATGSDRHLGHARCRALLPARGILKMHRPFRFATLVVILSLAGLGLACAHAHLESATPGDGVQLTQTPAQLTLTFSEGINLAFSSVELTGPNDQAIATGKPT